ncbi:MAG: polysaccharide biosynthesis/export family protein, partial [Pseudomonadota bacterium]
MLKFLVTSLLVLFAGVGLAQSTYLIQPGDRLTVTVVEDNTLNTQSLVGPDGTISVPAAGTIRVSGLTTVAVERVIRNRLASQFQEPPTVAVGLAALGTPLGQVETLNIYVLGEVGNAGQLQVEPGTTILQALALAGGTTQFAADKRIQLRRV